MNNQAEEKTDNELIAEFMGLTISKKYGLEVEMPPDNPSAKGYLITPKYDTSWDWLMPVVEKIESLGYKFAVCRRRVDVVSDNGQNWMIVSTKEETKLQSVHKAVVDFIKWYYEHGKN